MLARAKKFKSAVAYVLKNIRVECHWLALLLFFWRPIPGRKTRYRGLSLRRKTVSSIHIISPSPPPPINGAQPNYAQVAAALRWPCLLGFAFAFGFGPSTSTSSSTSSGWRPFGPRSFVEWEWAKSTRFHSHFLNFLECTRNVMSWPCQVHMHDVLRENPISRTYSRSNSISMIIKLNTLNINVILGKRLLCVLFSHKIP